MNNFTLRYFKFSRLLSTLILLISLLTYLIILSKDILVKNNLEFIKIPSVSAIIFIILYLANRYLYKFPFLWNFFMNVPYLGGEYKGNIKFVFENSLGEKIEGEKVCDMKDFQTCSIIKIDCEFYYEKNDAEKTYSESFAEYIEEKENRVKLYFPYRNSGILIDDKIPEALGFTTLDYKKDKQTLQGHYFSARNESKGGKLTVNKII